MAALTDKQREAEAGGGQETGLLKGGKRVEKVRTTLRGGNYNQEGWMQRDDRTKCPKTGCGKRGEATKREVRSGERRKNQEKLADVSQCS